MKFLATLVTLAAVAAAAPGGDRKECKPRTYSCTHGPKGQPAWQVCDTSGHWVFAGNCPPKTKCYFNEENQSPYCI